MRTILIVSAALIALTSCANRDQTSADSGGSAPCVRLIPWLFGQGAIPTACSYVRDSSYADPTGEETRGPDGEISLYTAHAGGSG